MKLLSYDQTRVFPMHQFLIKISLSFLEIHIFGLPLSFSHTTKTNNIVNFCTKEVSLIIGKKFEIVQINDVQKIITFLEKNFKYCIESLKSDNIE